MGVVPKVAEESSSDALPPRLLSQIDTIGFTQKGVS
jgi:hypothetical protein